MISFECPHCGVGIKVGDEWAGRVGKCNDCGNNLTVPQRVQTIQQTSKGWKSVQAIGLGVFVLGAVGLFMAVMQEQQAIAVGACVVAGVGVLVYVYGRLGGWWHHG